MHRLFCLIELVLFCSFVYHLVALLFTVPTSSNVHGMVLSAVGVIIAEAIYRRSTATKPK